MSGSGLARRCSPHARTGLRPSAPPSARNGSAPCGLPSCQGQPGGGRPPAYAGYLNDCTPAEAFGNFLVFVDRELGGFLPAHTEYRRFYHRFVLRDFGGQASVEAHLAADSLTLVAALVIILTDCAWNLATGLELRVGCIRSSTRPGHFEIHSFKARADKPQIATLPNKAPVPYSLTVRHVVAMVLEMTGRARALAEAGVRDFPPDLSAHG